MASNPMDVAYLLFARVIPFLDADARLDIVDSLRDCDFDSALGQLIFWIDDLELDVDPDLLAQGRLSAA